MSVAEGTVLADRYKIGSCIAEGNMSSVFEAYDQQLNRQIAVKILSPGLTGDQEFISRFRHEAQAAAGLNHPNIVRVYDQGKDGDIYFIVMEYVRGRPLSDFLKKTPQLNPTAAVEIILKVAAALEAAHKNGIIHRDIKPSNILITSDEEIKVADFGIAHIIEGDTAVTETGPVLGTAAYFSPEQARGEPTTATSDLYSLGIVFYEMLSGGVPFQGDTAMAVAYKHLEETLPPLPKEIPPPLVAIVMRLLEKTPERRFQSAGELIVTLEGREGSLFRALSWSGIFLVLSVGIALATYFVIFTGYTIPEERVEVISVYSVEEQSAVAELTNRGLTVTVQRATNIQIPKGLVYEQNPRPGAKLNPGDEVVIFISEGGDLKPVPEVVGQDVADAQRLLQSADFQYATTTQYIVDPTPAEIVISQTPAAGENLAPGETVSLVVSQGIERVPDLRAYPLDRALMALQDLNYEVDIQYIPHIQIPMDLVIDTRPTYDEPVPDPRDIIVLVSSGPPLSGQLEMPNVTGFKEVVAEFELEKLGFTTDVVYRDAASDENRGSVVSQFPQAGDTVPFSATVRIVVAR